MHRARNDVVEAALLAPLVEPSPGLLHRSIRVPIAAHHGIVRLHDVLAVDPVRFSALAGVADPLNVSDALFLDVETTGLGRGDEVVFLVGTIALEREFVVVEQWLLAGDGDLRARAAEREMLERVVARAAAKKGLVTFVGKAFDRHRLDDRVALVLGAGERPFAAMPHVDLYHVSRRLFAPRLRDGRLATLEADLLGVARGRDLSGAECPEAWLDFVESGDRSRIDPVLRHNALDALSLVALLARADQVFAAPEDALEAARAGLLFHARDGGACEEIALSLLERACAHRSSSSNEMLAAIEALTDRLSRRGDHARALQILEGAMESAVAESRGRLAARLARLQRRRR